MPPLFTGFGAAATPTPAAPASAFGGFGSAPTPAGGGLFGSTPNPAAAPTGGIFGGAPAPGAGGLFGNPAPTPGGLFGGGTTPAPAPFAFGGTFGPTPAPSTNFGSGFGARSPAPFGATPAPAAGFDGFWAPSPAPFGPAPATGFGAQSTMAATAPVGMSGQALYSHLPADQKRVLDDVHKAMMNHRRTIATVSNMAPQLLEERAQADAGAGGSKGLTLVQQVNRIKSQVEQLKYQLRTLQESLHFQKEQEGKNVSMAIAHALWPTEFAARQNGITVTQPPSIQAASLSEEEKKQEENERIQRELFDRASLHVDQLRRMPSPYLWDLIHEMEGRAKQLQGQLQSLKEAAATPKLQGGGNTLQNILAVVEMQEQAIWKVGTDIANVHAKVDQLRRTYTLFEKGDNVLHMEREREMQHERMLEQRQKMQLIQTLPNAAAGTLGTTAPAPLGGGLFGSSRAAPAPTGLFGSNPAPAPGGLFGGSAPAPTSSGGLFGATAPSPGLFGGQTPAPSPGLFGAPTPAPATSGITGFNFGATPGAAPTPAAPAPALGGGLFGGATPAPPPGGAPSFGVSGAPATSWATSSFGATASTPKSKGRKSRSTSRRS